MYRNVIPPRGRYRYYRGRYRVGDDPKVYDVNLKVTNRETAEKLLKEIHTDAERVANGLEPIYNKSNGIADKPFDPLFAAFLADLNRRGRSKSYCGLVRQRFTFLANDCGWKRICDITAESFMGWRNRQTEYKPCTLNHYLAAASVFLNWVENTHNISNRLKNVKNVSSQKGHQYGPRAFSEDELEKLIAAAPDRALLYRFLSLTGLRRQEARKLCWGDVQIGQKPHLVLRAEMTKSKRNDTIYLPESLACEIQAIRPECCKNSDPVFRNGVPSYETLKRDLKKANVALVDEYARGAGFHTFRRTFITLLQKQNTAPRIIQELARHKSLNLTNNVYTDTTKLPLFEAVEKLDTRSTTSESVSRTLPCFSGLSGQTLSTSGNQENSIQENPLSKVVAKGPFSYDLSTPVHDSPSIEMERAKGFEPLTSTLARSCSTN